MRASVRGRRANRMSLANVIPARRTGVAVPIGTGACEGSAMVKALPVGVQCAVFVRLLANLATMRWPPLACLPNGGMELSLGPVLDGRATGEVCTGRVHGRHPCRLCSRRECGEGGRVGDRRLLGRPSSISHCQGSGARGGGEWGSGVVGVGWPKWHHRKYCLCGGKRLSHGSWQIAKPPDRFPCSGYAW